MSDPLAVLPTLARNALAAHFGLPERTTSPQEDCLRGAVNPEILQKPGACFVTLTRNGELRGCIGSLEAHRSLGDDLHSNALAAALRDPRFPPLTATELPQVEIEISVLSAPQPLAFADEADALAKLRPGIDGVILAAGNRRATFLPQVWEQLPTAADFMARLKQKAGLPADYWGPDVRLAIYQVQAFHEVDQGESE
ncbi:AmmeMemoRadiSam system protein A [Dechloromonas sp.]|uniref:AmmeMemoRadiSam system protein A n=1 Tax=Dechloromonas sp. TaxID=1917218 RepID=UPI00121CDD3F|nr:AmmeMemoRadiSam system protein A [Dechloromonas sp.]MBU3697345.1 AmmeMemoRadiSam system protein A [Dechloromonas sp.]TEX49071.1 MAG: AMMECR1 domain-containing protein [Rhodocyclaceae bacterium]